MTIAGVLASPWPVAVLFFIIAYTYASVGLGGASAYTALMVLLVMCWI